MEGQQDAAEAARPPSTPVQAHTEAETSSPSVQGSDTDKTPTSNQTHDSLVTVRLSEPPNLHVNTKFDPTAFPTRRSVHGVEYTPTDAIAEDVTEESDYKSDEPRTPTASLEAELQGEYRYSQDEADEQEEQNENDTAENRHSSDSEEVNWEQLQKSEDQESKEKDADNSTAMLLARLEQENNKLATNPKSIKVKVVENLQSPSRRPRPPSMAQLRQMVDAPPPSALRYSMLPPPPMTDLEFYMALVRDYQQTAARLPTLLANKVRKGIPPPLRGVVWQSMSGARDSMLEDAFERLSGESSPYEGLIGKDLGRSFPGVEMFMEPDGDGQRMLGRVLKVFSLYDTKIGYCQGLAFLVGPLLMHMPDKQAFCVLVRLMDNYDLRQCFVPDLSGLHVRIYQFQELLRQHLPDVSRHLDDLQVDPAYVSQWFLSFFAVTCPLPMLFRIYDVVFAEGASETIMRVALSLMRKNETRILACSEMEDVMQLLLSRGLWDGYHYNADEFVLDFVSLSNVVSRERLAALAQAYREAQINTLNPKNATPNAASEVTAVAASTFLGRLWSVSTPRLATFAQSFPAGPLSSSPTNTVNSTLSPGLTAPIRPMSMLRRSASKQSLASTLNSMEAASSSFTTSSAASVLSSTSTDATSLSRDSNPTEDFSRASGTRPNTKTAPPPLTRSVTARDDERYMQSQIEDLLTALTELQRNNAVLASQLQKEKEDRDEDNKAVRLLLDGLRKKAGKSTSADSDQDNAEDDTTSSASEDASDEPTPEQLSGFLDAVELRFPPADNSPRSSTSLYTKEEMRAELARAKEQLANEMAKSQDSARMVSEAQQETAATKDQLRDSHALLRKMHAEKQKLEKQMHDLRARTPEMPYSSSALVEAGEWLSKATGLTTSTSVPAPGGGLRELKLGRSKSTPAQGPNSSNKRASSLTLPASSHESIAGMPAPATEQDALILELVQAKTAEAIARQEAEEAKQKLETLRKAFGLAVGETPPGASNTAATQASAAASAAIGMFSRFAGSATAPGTTQAAGGPAPLATSGLARVHTTPAAAAGNGFWGWRR